MGEVTYVNIEFGSRELNLKDKEITKRVLLLLTRE